MSDPIAALTRATADAPILVGYSGGLDSTVLLHALAAQPQVRARGLRAMHVHHGMQAGADAWAEHCLRTCRDWDIPCEVAHVQVRLDRGMGPEGAARDARFAAFRAALVPGETLALAQHRRDQAETVLLRLLRAAGSDGLGAMRPSRPLAPGRIWRPLLPAAPEAIRDYAAANQLGWIEDPSNANPRFDRNFLRQRVLPTLRERWPEGEAALARSAVLLAEDAQLLAEAGEARLAAARTPDPCTLALQPLRALSPAWRARVLRLWLAGLGLPAPPGRAFALLDQELLQARPDAQPEYRWAGIRLQCWRELLHVDAAQASPTPGFDCEWNGESLLALPDGGSLELLHADQGSEFALPSALAPLRVGNRRGGERIRLPGRDHSHALKDCLLQAGVPPWLRRSLPLVRAADDELLAAGDLVVSDRWQREAGARGLRLLWTPPALLRD